MSVGPQEAPRIRLEHASFGYGRRAVLEGVDLEIGDGEFVGVLGHNGSGKTTLLRGMMGLLEPMGGRVRFGDVRLGYVPQRETLDPVFPVTVFEVVSMGLFGSAQRKLSRVDQRRAVECELERVALGQHAGALFSSLSGGQRQRVLIARALVTQPNVLILDEPTSGVDRPTAERLLELITRLNQVEGLTIVIVSHQLSMTRTVGSVVWVAEGRVHRGRASEMLEPERLEELFGVAIVAESVGRRAEPGVDSGRAGGER